MRNVHYLPSYGESTSIRDNLYYTSAPDWKGDGWYRFLPPAGTQIADHPPELNLTVGSYKVKYQGS